MRSSTALECSLGQPFLPVLVAAGAVVDEVLVDEILVDEGFVDEVRNVEVLNDEGFTEEVITDETFADEIWVVLDTDDTSSGYPTLETPSILQTFPH
jgi:hypothetical protein